MNNKFDQLNQEYKTTLRQILTQKHQSLYNQPERLNKVKSFFAPKRLVAVVSLMVIIVLALTLYSMHNVQNNSVKKTNNTFIQAAKAAYEKMEEILPSQVRHQKVLTSYLSEPNKTEIFTVETWIAENQSAEIIFDQNNQVFDKYVEIRDGDHPKIFTLKPIEVVLPPDSDEPQVYCTIGSEYTPPNWKRANNIDEALNITNAQERADALKALIDDFFASGDTIDLGEKDGLHGFQLLGGTIVSEYYFNTESFQLKKILQKENNQIIHSAEYLVDENLPLDSLNQNVFDTTGLAPMPSEYIEQSGPDLTSKPTGCYDQNGNFLHEINGTVEMTEDSVSVQVGD